jgi:hypothetical protein
MKKPAAASFLASSLLCLAALSFGENPTSAADKLQRLQAEMRHAREAGDWPLFFSGASKQRELLNGSPNALLDLSRAYIHTGDRSKALDEIKHYQEMGQATQIFATLADFATFRDDPRFKALSQAMNTNQAPIGRSVPVFSISDPTLLTEDVDYDPESKRFLVTSILQKKILAVDGNGHVDDFVQAPDGWPMMAIKVDSRHRLLWVTEVALDNITAAPKADWGKSAVLCYGLSSRKLVHRVEGPAKSALGDMALTGDGDVIVSDGAGGGVYRLRREGTQLERLDKGDFISPQTPAMHPDSKHAFVPDYLRGIGILDLSGGQVHWIGMENRFALNGIDGLYFYRGRLLAVQNGTSPERVIAFRLDESLSRIVSQEVIERATRTLGEPTHGVVIGEEFFYIANSGWDTVDDNGNLKPGASRSPAHLMRMNLAKIATQ